MAALKPAFILDKGKFFSCNSQQCLHQENKVPTFQKSYHFDMGDECNVKERVKDDYKMRPIVGEDTKEIVDFLRKFFFMDEPLNVAVGLMDKPDSTCPELEEYCVKSIPEGLSLVAVKNSGKIVGVILNSAERRDGRPQENCARDYKESAATKANQKFGKIHQFLKSVDKLSDTFGHFPTIDKYLEMRIVSVDDACRGQGIAKALIDETTKMAKELNFPLIKVDCSSHFSAKAVAKLGFQCIFTLSYEDYMDENGQRVFYTKPPHTCIKTFVLPLIPL